MELNTRNAQPVHVSGLSWLALIASNGTLICCALPIALVSLGLGATLAALISAFPLLTILGEYKSWIFAVSGALILIATQVLWRSSRHCPTDPVLAKRCRRATSSSRRVLGISVGLWVIGFCAAYLALPVRIWLDF